MKRVYGTNPEYLKDQKLHSSNTCNLELTSNLIVPKEIDGVIKEVSDTLSK